MILEFVVHGRVSQGWVGDRWKVVDGLSDVDERVSYIFTDFHRRLVLLFESPPEALGRGLGFSRRI